MKSPPIIVVEFIHIHGPMKGNIQEFADGYISIGRHPSCSIRFPADLVNISRKHAEVIREGNQFKLVDLSTNGTFVNGKKVKETYLRDGDVLELSEGGPKISFLTKCDTIQKEQVQAQVNPHQDEFQIIPENISLKRPLSIEKPLANIDEVTPKKHEVEVVADIPSNQKSTVPLIVQYGPTIRSFKQVPVIIGKNQAADLVISHPAILDQHAQIFYYQNQYWIKDLTGLHLIRINNKPIDMQSPLSPNDEIYLTPQGPVFCFLGDGRLAELAEPNPDGASIRQEENNNATSPVTDKSSEDFWSKMKKRF